MGDSATTEGGSRMIWPKNGVKFRELAGAPGYEISSQAVVRNKETWEVVPREPNLPAYVVIDGKRVDVIAARDSAWPENAPK